MKERKVPSSKETRKRSGGSAVFSLVVSILFFVSLLHLFDPLASSPPSAVQVGLEHFSRGREFNQTLIQQAALGREPILRILQQAGINLSPDQIMQLPEQQHMVQLYGPDVVIVGQEHCQDYQTKVPLKDRKVAVAGLFNTGTNLLNIQMRRNIRGVETLWQTPWGKHRLAQVKWNHTASSDMAKYKKDHVLPVVIVRDPLAWLQSMCSHPYVVRWRHGPHHCPNFIPNQQDRTLYHHLHNVFAVTVKYDSTSQVDFDSLAHLWSEWHLQYMQADYPVLMVRFEDLVFQPEQVLTEIANCLGATLRQPLVYQAKTSKNHGSGTDLFKAMIKTANAQHRLHNLTQQDKEYAQEHLDASLMRIFHYHGPVDEIALENHY